MNSSVIIDYLEVHNLMEDTTAVKRTRASTRKFLNENKVEFKKLLTKKDIKVAFYELNGLKHEIKIEKNESIEKITEVSCSDCKEICKHRQLLLRQILKNIEEEKEKDEAVQQQLIKKRKISTKNSKASKIQRIDAENDSSLFNAQSTAEVHDEIKLVKKKKIVELDSDLLAKIEVLKMENLIKSFGRGQFKDFHDHCVKVMNENSDAVKIVNELTVEQADTNIWHELRIGRITASRLHETTRCTMTRGSLVDKFMGQKSGWSFAMARGTILEEFVFEEVKKEFPDLQRAGLIMNQHVHPFFAASPDGFHKDFVLEIKCPNTQNTFDTYIDVDKLSRKYFAQIQLQMLITGKTKALLAVAALDFEKTRKITKIWIPLDEEYMNDMIEQATEFYEKAIFPALKRKFL